MDEHLQRLCDEVSQSVDSMLEQYDWDGKFKEYMEGLG
jgi:hypothetical protein